MLNLITVNIFLAVADKLLDFLWFYLALTLSGSGDNKALLAVIIQMIILRTLFYFLFRKIFRQTNFYGQYIYGLAAGFIIILIGIRSENLYWLVFLVALKEIFSIFRLLGSKNSQAELGISSPRLNYLLNVFPWTGILFAYLIITYYETNNLINSIFAALALLIGIPTILIYAKYSKAYAKGITEIVDTTEKKNKWMHFVYNTGTGLCMAVSYAVFIFATENVLAGIIAISVIGIILETAKALVLKGERLYEIDYALYTSFWMIGLGIALFVV
jgi:hypothetical protein